MRAAHVATLLAALLPLAAARALEAPATAALIIVDVQRCFLKGGALATCCHSEAVLLRRINRLAAARKWAAVVVTQDWHPPGHISFASAFPGAAPFSSVNLTYAPDGALLGVDGNATSAGANDTTISQVLWPEHCVANTSGASLAAGLAVPQGANVISLLKGRDSSIDDYSAFRKNDRRQRTALAAQLHALNVTSVWAVGLALDYCVGWTAKDALLEGFSATVVVPATAPVTAAGGRAAARQLEKEGVRVLARMPTKRQLRT